MQKHLTSALLASLLCFGASLFSSEDANNPKKALATIMVNGEKKHTRRRVTFSNNLAEISELVTMPEDRLQALEELAKKATVYVNNVEIPHDASVVIPVIGDSCTIRIKIPASQCQPFFNPKGMFKALAWFFEVHVSFTYHLDPADNKILVILPLISKIEEWEHHTPSVHVNYQFPATGMITVTDFAKE